MAEPVWIRVVGRLEAQSAGVTVHLLKKVLHRLIGLESALVLVDGAACATISAGVYLILLLVLLEIVCVALFIILEARCNLKQILAEVFSQAHGGIVAARQHESVQ